VACGFGTAYEAVRRADVSGRDAVLVTGLGPVGLAVGLLAGALGSRLRIGVDTVESRRRLAVELGAVDVAVPADDAAVEAIKGHTGGHGCEAAVDCSGSTPGRRLAVLGCRRWGRCVLVGEGARLEVDASPALIHPQLTLIGSWVTSIGRMEELVGLLVRWELHPERVVTDRFPLDQADAAYRAADDGSRGKVAIVMDGGR
jgi:threonine dehydrogenase-like Zn-dependent dehydrogenase